MRRARERASVAFIFSPKFRARNDIPCIRREYFLSTGGNSGSCWLGWTIAGYVILTEARRTRTLKGPVVACFSNAFRCIVFGILNGATFEQRMFSFTIQSVVKLCTQQRRSNIKLSINCNTCAYNTVTLAFLHKLRIEWIMVNSVTRTIQ